MKKRVFSLVLAVCTALALLSAPGAGTARASEPGRPDSFRTISASVMDSAAVKSDGTLWTWGENYFSQLGNGGGGDMSTNYGNIQTTPVQVMENVVSAAVGSHSGAIQSDGSLWMWGLNEYGQLGNGRVANAGTAEMPYQTTPVKIMDHAAALSLGGDTTGVIKTDGTLWVWGQNRSNELGNGGKGNKKDSAGNLYQTVPVKLMDHVAAVSMDYQVSAAVKTDGTLWMWGSWVNSAVPVKKMSGVASIALGSGLCAAVKTDGTLWTWLLYGNSSVGSTAVSTSRTPVKIASGVASVSADGGDCAFVKTDGTLWMWGVNQCGEMGLGNHKSSSVPVKIMGQVAAVSTSGSHTLILKTDGTLLACGANFHGELGNGRVYNETIFAGREVIQTTPVQVLTSVRLPDGSAAQAGDLPFWDVSSSAYCHDAVKWAVGKGVTAGTTAATFSPNQTCTQAQILTFLWRAAGKPEAGSTASYTNSAVTSGKYYYKALAWAAEKGIVTDLSLDPDARCTRADAALYLWRNAGSPAASPASFTDVPADSACAGAVAWAVEQGVTKGTSATAFSPDSACTRGQIVTFLYRDLAK